MTVMVFSPPGFPSPNVLHIVTFHWVWARHVNVMGEPPGALSGDSTGKAGFYFHLGSPMVLLFHQRTSMYF